MIPELGRWTKRYPIEEEGGVNLYNFIGDNVKGKKAIQKTGVYPYWENQQ